MTKLVAVGSRFVAIGFEPPTSCTPYQHMNWVISKPRFLFEYLFSYYHSRNMKISQKQLIAYRAETYHMKPGQQLTNHRQAAEFVNQGDSLTCQ
jgi:hypothetical protein